MDIASVKTAIANAVSAGVITGRICQNDSQRYIGTHPMAGRERSGPGAARGELFTAAPGVLCSSEATPQYVINTASEVARLLGATRYRMTDARPGAADARTRHRPPIPQTLP